jgi:hypothetical protein
VSREEQGGAGRSREEQGGAGRSREEQGGAGRSREEQGGAGRSREGEGEKEKEREQTRINLGKDLQHVDTTQGPLAGEYLVYIVVSKSKAMCFLGAGVVSLDLGQRGGREERRK